jgi:Flp pilus assembly protein TadG
MYLIKMLGKFFRSWVDRKEGTTAIEFSLMAIPYFMLTIGILEVSIMYASACLLEGATTAAARLIRTGQVQQAESADPEEMFRDAVCDYAEALIACDKVIIEVRQMESFDDYDSMGAQYDEDGNMVSQGFDAGGSNDRVLIRVAYRYEMLTPFIGPLLVGPDNSRQFMSTIVLQTEPYEFAGAT